MGKICCIIKSGTFCSVLFCLGSLRRWMAVEKMDNILVLSLLLFFAAAIYMEEVFLDMRWILVAVAFAVIAMVDKIYFFRFRLRKKSKLKKIDEMDGVEFEKYASDLLRANGFKNVRLTPSSGDQGVDIIAHFDGASYAIQCKRYHGRVSNKAVQEAFTGCGFYHCDVAAVLTNSFFTVSAKQLAEENGVILWDRKELIRMIEHI